jgi:hypothetical protein
MSQVELPVSLIRRSVDFALQVWEVLSELNPPDDWCPLDLDDPILQDVFSRVWPESLGRT